MTDTKQKLENRIYNGERLILSSIETGTVYDSDGYKDKAALIDNLTDNWNDVMAKKINDIWRNHTGDNGLPILYEFAGMGLNVDRVLNDPTTNNTKNYFHYFELPNSAVTGLLVLEKLFPNEQSDSLVHRAKQIEALSVEYGNEQGWVSPAVSRLRYVRSTMLKSLVDQATREFCLPVDVETGKLQEHKMPFRAYSLPSAELEGLDYPDLLVENTLRIKGALDDVSVNIVNEDYYQTVIQDHHIEVPNSWRYMMAGEMYQQLSKMISRGKFDGFKQSVTIDNLLSETVDMFDAIGRSGDGIYEADPVFFSEDVDEEYLLAQLNDLLIDELENRTVRVTPGLLRTFAEEHGLTGGNSDFYEQDGRVYGIIEGQNYTTLQVDFQPEMTLDDFREHFIDELHSFDADEEFEEIWSRNFGQRNGYKPTRSLEMLQADETYFDQVAEDIENENQLNEPLIIEQSEDVIEPDEYQM